MEFFKILFVQSKATTNSNPNSLAPIKRTHCKFNCSLPSTGLAKPVDGREQLNLQWVRFIGANEFGLEFVVAFDCTKRILKNSMQDSVMMEIHKTLRHAGVQMSAGKLYGKLEEDTGLHALEHAVLYLLLVFHKVFQQTFELLHVLKFCEFPS